MSIFDSLITSIDKNPLGAIGTAASLAMGIGSTKRQKKLMAYQDQINDENYAKQREDALSDYHMQLEDQRQLRDEDRQYNSISAQMQRARDANISPLAALGVSANSSIGGMSPVSSSDTGSVSPPSNDSSSHFGNAITLATSLKELKQRDKQLQIEEERADADNALKREQERKTEVERLLLEIEKSFKDDQEKAKLKGMLADNDIKGVEKALKEQEHQQKEEMFPLEKRESESRTELNKAHADKASFEDWYQRTHHRTLSNGLSHFIDVLMDSVGGKTPVIEDAIDEVTDGKGLIKGAKEGLFSFLNKHVPYLSDQALKEYVGVLWDYLKTINFRSLR